MVSRVYAHALMDRGSDDVWTEARRRVVGAWSTYRRRLDVVGTKKRAAAGHSPLRLHEY